ncbi:NAD(P)/FAD-dependent oxidoreductase [Pseudoduganella namucuonensis]|uniref:Glycine/D-amino acid oxidase n=1 Tax=Pseudoduganella namucuonensis TaxID=1035707 RepID=A0A1I7K610_9BURK|nr:FAD-dependent oxidoreductase [Pseudoduganella namucuonensis]SFU92844.1 Glycine/D-amino acid oxidase [Pseudoduganella namucuonensis]
MASAGTPSDSTGAAPEAAAAPGLGGVSTAAAGGSADVLVVGAGIVGAACADALAARGLRVTVIEQEVVGSGATAAGMGHLVVMDDNPAELALSSYSLELWREFVADQPARHEYSRCGTIWVAADDEELDAARLKAATMAAHGLECRMLDAAALYALEPQLRPGLAGGLLVAGDGLVYPPKSARILLDRALARGARLVAGCVRAIEDGGVLLADGTRLRAGAVVVAAGSRSSQLLPELPVQPKKGHVAITDRYPGFIRHQLVELGYIKSAHAASGDSVAFNLQPRPTGQILIGSSRQFGATDPAVEPDMMARMLRHAVGFTPALRGLNVLRCWTGLRAASPDGLPLIGEHPGRPGVWLATGHEGLGITTSLATAQLLAARIAGGDAAIPAQPYLPERFATLQPNCEPWGQSQRD